MAGTVILTGANGSAGLHASEYLLKSYPQLTAFFTVRSAASTDPNTSRLRDIISRYPDVKASIHELDLSNLRAVNELTTTLSTAISAGQYPPLKAIICNAYYWNLVTDPELTGDGLDKTLQVNHIAHVALILRLLDSFGPDGGRIELISSVAHLHKKTPMSPYLPEVPADINQLVHPPSDPDKKGHGFTRYAVSKLVITIWAYALNRYLEKDPKLSNITAVAINPGSFGDSRAFQTNTPASVKYLQTFILKPLMPLMRRFVDPTFRSSASGGVDMIELGVNSTYDKKKGYFTLLEPDEPDPVVLDQHLQQKIWEKSLEWCKITAEDTALKGSFG